MGVIEYGSKIDRRIFLDSEMFDIEILEIK